MPEANVVAHGIDALYVSGTGQASADWLRELAVRRDFAATNGGHVDVNLGGDSFLLAPHRWQRYSFCLDHPRGRVGIATDPSTPVVRLQPRSWWLHEAGPAAAIDWFVDALRSHVALLELQASRLDLYADLHGLPLERDTADALVSRARTTRIFREGPVVTGIQLGARATAAPMARIYDKTLQLSTSPDQPWWTQLWSANPSYVVGEPVTRVEFELSRPLLSQLAAVRLVDAIDRAAGMWVWLTDWLTLRTDTGDTNRSRWPIDVRWEAVQDAFAGPDVPLVERASELRRAHRVELLVPALVGYLTTCAALCDTTTVDATIGELRPFITAYLSRSGAAFEDRVAVRRQQIVAGRGDTPKVA